MNGGEQLDGINRTRALEALAPFLENPRQTVIRNEGFVVAAAAMLFLQLVLAPWRRRSGHWFVQGTLWVAYNISFPLITYTFGQMVTSPVKNGLYPIWGLILFWAAGCANAFRVYSIEDNKHWKRYFFELYQYFAYLAVIFRLLRPGRDNYYLGWGAAKSIQPIVLPLLLLATMVFFTNLHRIAAGMMVTNSIPSKLVADYMRAQVDARAAKEYFDPITMNGYRYLVRPSFGRCDRGNNIILEDDAVTINKVWEMTYDDRLFRTSGGGSPLKDVCLSFALSHLLLRHYFELDCAEVGLRETFRFALEGLLPDTDQVNHYSRAFHIVEVELGFLYDLFFTKYATLFKTEVLFPIVMLVKLICTSIGGALLLVYCPTLRTLDPIIEVSTRRVDVTVTVVILGALLLFEALQAILYLTSDWAIVSLACSYATQDKWRLMPSTIRMFRRCKFDKFLGRIKFSGYWQNKIGQSSVIDGSLSVDRTYTTHSILNRSSAYSSTAKAIVLSSLAMFGLSISMLRSKKKFIPIPGLVKNEIVSCLRTYSNGGPLTNGKAALDGNGILGEFSYTVENHSQTRVMLIWHIATEYCNISSSDGAEVQQSGARQVATTLSKYCAYLMVFLPELLPGNSTDTLFVVHDVLSKVQSALHGHMPTSQTFLKIIQDSESSSSNDGRNQDHTVTTTIDIPTSRNEDNIIHDSGSSNNDQITNNNAPLILEDSIFIEGLKLGMELEKKDAALRWKLLAEFWAETIIYIAPSDKAAVHMERLAQGGEFLTHIWALLKHAGITTRDYTQTPEELL
uniref:Uncharacterized protein n=1 Tax=Avena sativa TaxID=4498 RepID=A0ACD5TGM9_AVESA